MTWPYVLGKLISVSHVWSLIRILQLREALKGFIENNREWSKLCKSHGPLTSPSSENEKSMAQMETLPNMDALVRWFTYIMLPFGKLHEFDHLSYFGWVAGHTLNSLTITVTLKYVDENSFLQQRQGVCVSGMMNGDEYRAIENVAKDMIGEEVYLTLGHNQNLDMKKRVQEVWIVLQDYVILMA